jgi:hypothetical protein
MNIFAVSECPRQAARDLDDARVIKQVTETAQLLSTVARLLAPEWVGQMGPLFRLAHEHHPVTEWVGSSWEAFSYALEHGLALHVEYCSRFPDRLGIHRGAIPINSVLGASRAFIQPRMFRHNAQPAPTLPTACISPPAGGWRWTRSAPGRPSGPARPRPSGWGRPT